MMGDFNFGDINWDCLQANTASSKLFLDAMNDAFLVQHVESGTRGDRILDLVFTSENEMVENLEVSCPVASSDHNVLTFRLILETVLDESSFKYLNYHKGNYGKICDELEGIDWNNRFDGLKVIICGMFLETR